MIIGVGTDLCDIRRIEKALEKFGERFKRRLYSDCEQAKAEGKVSSANSYAQGFAAKEACSKALGTGFCQGVFWRDMVVRNLETGQPYMEITGGALKRLNSLIPANMKANVCISQTDEYPMAHAIVIISANFKGYGD